MSTDSSARRRKQTPGSLAFVFHYSGHLLVLVAVVLGLVLLCGSAVAQDDEGVRADLVGVVSPPKVQAVQLDILWRNTVDADDRAARDDAVRQYAELMFSMGIDNAPAEATALLREAEKATDAGDFDRAQALIEHARKIAPAWPHVAFAQAALTARSSPTSVFLLAEQVAVGYDQSWSFLPTRYTFIANWGRAAVVAYLLIALVLALASLIRYSSVLSADLTRVVPGVTTWQVAALGGIGLVFLSALLGPAIAGLVIAIGLSGYMAWRERIRVAAVVLVLAVIPQLAAATDDAVQYPGSRSAELELWNLTGCRQDCALQLERALENPKGDTITLARVFLLSRRELRIGDEQAHQRALARLEKMAASRALPSSMRAATLNNLGVALALAGQGQRSVDVLQSAAKTDPTDYRPHVNLFRILTLVGEGELAEDALRRALDLGGDHASAQTNDGERTINKWYALAPLPVDAFEETFAVERSEQVRSGVWALAGGFVPPGVAPVLAILLLAGIGAMMVVRRVVSLSQSCVRCGANIEPEPERDPNATCRNCERVLRETHQQQTPGKGRPPIDAALEKQMATMGRFRSRSWLLFAAGNLVFPGLGSLVYGRHLGLVATTLFATGVAFIFFVDAPLRDPWQLTTLWFDSRQVFAATLVLVGVLLSVVLVVLGRLGDVEEDP